MSKTNLQQQITVYASPSKVWKVLTCPEYITQYFFENNISCNWIEGSPILVVSEKGEKTEAINKGKVLESVPGMLLKFSFLDGNTTTYIITTYDLIIAGDGVELKIKCEGFTASHQEYLIRVQQANLLLQKIKWLSEYS